MLHPLDDWIASLEPVRLSTGTVLRNSSALLPDPTRIDPPRIPPEQVLLLRAVLGIDDQEAERILVSCGLGEDEDDGILLGWPAEALPVWRSGLDEVLLGSVSGRMPPETLVTLEFLPHNSSRERVTWRIDLFSRHWSLLLREPRRRRGEHYPRASGLIPAGPGMIPGAARLLALDDRDFDWEELFRHAGRELPRVGIWAVEDLGDVGAELIRMGHPWDMLLLRTPEAVATWVEEDRTVGRGAAG